MSAFSLEATDGAARAGVVHTSHGDVETPAFMPVGTKGTVKTVDPDELRELVTEAWRLTAPKRLLKAFDEAHPVPGP